MANIADGVLEICVVGDFQEALEVLASEIRNAIPFAYACPPSIEIKRDHANAVLVVGFGCAWTGEQCWDWLDEQMGEESRLPGEARELLIASSLYGSVTESAMEWEEEVYKKVGESIVIQASSDLEPYQDLEIEELPFNRLVVDENGALVIPAHVLTTFCKEGSSYEVRHGWVADWGYASLKVELVPDDLVDEDSPYESTFSLSSGLIFGKEALLAIGFKPGDVFQAEVMNETSLMLEWIGVFAEDSRLPKEWRGLDPDEAEMRISEGSADHAILTIMAESGNGDIRLAVARCQNAPDDVIEQLREDPYDAVRHAVNKRALPSDWRDLEDDDIVEKISEGLADHEILRIMAKSLMWSIRLAVARYKNAPDDVIEQLKDDSDDDVRQAVKERFLPADWIGLDDDQKVQKLRSNLDAVPIGVLEVLATSLSCEVRKEVALAPATSRTILQSLLDDSEESISEIALQGCLPDDWKGLDLNDVITRLELADQRILCLLSKSRNHWIRASVARCSLTPEDVRLGLINDEENEVMWAALTRDFPPGWQTLRLDWFSRNDMVVHALRRKARQDGPINESVLLALSRAPDNAGCWQLRKFVSVYELTPKGILESLAHDSDKRVSVPAKRRLKALG